MTLSGLFLTSCSPLEILPGLCYNDKDGTYICLTDHAKQSITRSADVPEFMKCFIETENNVLIDICQGIKLN